MSEYVVTIIIILVSIVIIVVAFWLISHISNHRYSSYLHDNLNIIRSVSVNLERSEVKFFNRNNIRRVRTVPLERYCWQFTKDDAKRFLNWINSLLSPIKKNTPINNYLEIDIRLHRAHRFYHSLFMVTKIDKERKTINFDSYLFYQLSSKGRFVFENGNKPIDNLTPYAKMVTGLRGYVANFQLSYISYAGKREVLPRLLYNQLKEIAAGTFSPPQKQMITTGNNEFAIIDYHSNDNNDALNYIHEVNNAMRKFLEINSKIKNVNVNVGLIYNSNFVNNPKKLVEKARLTSNVAYSKNTLIITYSKNMKNNSEESNYDSEIEQVIKKKQVLYNFQAVYSVAHEKIIGYIAMPSPINTSAKTMAELYERAVKTGENKQLIQMTVKDSSVSFKSNSNASGKVLFHHIMYNEINNFINAANLSAAKDLKHVAIFDEYDISFASKEPHIFNQAIQKLKEKEIGISLSLSDKSLILDHKVYLQFDYFFVYSNNAHLKRDDSDYLGLRTIIEKLIKYGKPIILTHIDAWSTIEMFIRSGVEYVASPTVCPLGDKLNEVASKTKAKIKRMLD
ncbi:MAG: hypothetical protein MJ208_04205 [Bacilli bacterium]|nr:hypothetical protein [Bacilli bacterium]